jgi:hypothetical protein
LGGFAGGGAEKIPAGEYSINTHGQQFWLHREELRIWLPDAIDAHGVPVSFILVSIE